MAELLFGSGRMVGGGRLTFLCEGYMFAGSMGRALMSGGVLLCPEGVAVCFVGVVSSWWLGRR